jgi:sulfate adenylyltransferase subunit 2
VRRDGRLILIDDDRLPLGEDDQVQTLSVRFRTLGCYPLTGATMSTAADVPAVIREMLSTRNSEREGRGVDKDGSASMERKKQEGYF